MSQFNPQQLAHIRNMKRSGYTTKQIAELYNSAQEEITAALRMPRRKPVASSTHREWARKLLKEGYDRELIIANFGDGAL